MENTNKELITLEAKLTEILTDVMAFNSTSPTNIKPDFSKIYTDLKEVVNMGTNIVYHMNRDGVQS